MKMSSCTAVLASACVMLAGAGYGQTQSNEYQQGNARNFYITTPQTGEQTAIRGNTNHNAGAQNTTANTYLAQTRWQRPTAAATTSRQSQQQAASTQQAAYSTQQVSYQPASQQAYTNYYVNSGSRNQAANYYTQQQAAQQTVYPASYVSNASNEKKGLLSRLLHRNSSSAHQHQHSNAVRQVVNAQARAAKSVAYRASKLAGRMQQGMASWYGGKWHGRKTANGERYNQESMTAAHKTLPFGTVVKVTNERNGRECMVRINNRGPFTKGRILDLSKAAARHLDMVGSGVAKIKMEVVGRS